MNKLNKKIASTIAASAMVMQIMTPIAFAQTSIVIEGNGSGADNYATVADVNTTAVTQSNTANVVNNVSSDAKTGGNTAGFNTGGPVTIVSGSASTGVSITNDLNTNAAEVGCCDTGNTEVSIKENGAFSDNTVTLTKVNATVVDQNNKASVKNNVDADASTGANKSNLNTGGDVTTVTGNAASVVNVSTKANTNVAHVTSPLGGSNPSASFAIVGNGAYADNWINANLVKTTTLDQDNSAHVYNDVDADAYTGKNTADFNTGGAVATLTGDATSLVGVDNAVNFNYAAVDCGCAWDVMAKIAGNGAEGPSYHSLSDNEWVYPYAVADNVINLGLNSAKVYGQDNYSHLNNDLQYLKADTGWNTNSSNTSYDGSDPLISTGAATSGTTVSNSGNVNHLGTSPLFDMPWDNANVSFNMSAVWAMFGLSLS